MASRPALLSSLESWTTRRFLWTVCLAAGLPCGAFVLTVALRAVSLDAATKYVDSFAKIVVTVGAALWALNRYFLGRVDAMQIRIDPRVELARKPNQASAALVYGIEILNTGRVLFNDYEIRSHVTAVDFTDESDEPAYYTVYEMPWHPGRPIEPASWAALSGVEVVPSDLVAVRLSVDIRTESGSSWTWHRVVKLPDD